MKQPCPSPKLMPLQFQQVRCGATFSVPGMMLFITWFSPPSSILPSSPVMPAPKKPSVPGTDSQPDRALANESDRLLQLLRSQVSAESI